MTIGIKTIPLFRAVTGVAAVSQECACYKKRERICLQCRRPGFDPWVMKILWRKKWQSTPVFSPGESHGQRILAGYSPWGCKRSDTTEQLTHTRMYISILNIVPSGSSSQFEVICLFKQILTLKIMKRCLLFNIAKLQFIDNSR